MNPTKTPFEEAFSQKKVSVIETVKGPLSEIQGQPEFIDFFEINGEPMAFLGLEDPSIITQANLEGKAFTGVSITLPAGLKMLKPSDFYSYLENDPRGTERILEETLGIYFYGGRLGNRVMLPVCSNIRPAPNNYLTSIHPCIESLGIMWCEETIFSPWFSSGEGWKHIPIVFYLPKPEDTIPDPPVTDQDKAWTRLLSEFKEVADGYFLIPVQNPDSGFSYFCIPNVDNYTYKYCDKGVRVILWEWMKGVNTLPVEEDIFIVSVDDERGLGIDAWNASFFRKVSLIKPA